MANYKEFSAKIKEKYPEYKDIPDDVLAQKMVEKYPEYKDQVTFETPKKSTTDLNRKIAEEARKTYSSLPLQERVLAGAGKQMMDLYQGARSLVGMPDQEYQAESDYFNKISADDRATQLGGVGADVAMMALPAGGGASIAARLMKSAPKAGKILTAGAIGAGAGIPSAGLHQVQNIGQGEGVSAGEVLGEVGLSAALPAGMVGLGQYLRKVAPDVLRTAIKPLKKYTRQINSPQFEVPLKGKDVTYFGGIPKLYEKVAEKTSKYGEMRDNALKQADLKINIDEVLNETENILRDNVNYGKIDADLYDKAIAGANSTLKDIDWINQKYTPENKILSGSDLVDLKKKAGKRGKFNKFDPSSTGDALYSEAFTKAINRQLDSKIIQGDVPKGIQTAYLTAKKELAKYTPITKAIEEASHRTQNNYGIGLMDAQALQVGQGMTTGNIPKAIGAGGMLGVRRLGATAGGAKMLYDLGGALQQQNPLTMQALRSSLFSQ